MGVRLRRSGSAKFTLPSPPYVVPRSEKSAWFWLMGRSCPSQSAHPLGGNPKLMILISLKNGSAILDLLQLRSSWEQPHLPVRDMESESEGEAGHEDEAQTR